MVAKRRRRTVVVIVAVAVIAAAVAVGVHLADVFRGSPAKTTTATAAPVSPTAISVSWVRPGVDVDQWVVQASTPDSSPAGRQTVCGTCSDTRFDYLTPATNYSFRIVGTGGDAARGVTASAAATTPPDPLCASGSTCVTVDATTSTEAAKQTGLGLINSVNGRVDRTRFDALHLNFHRITAFDERAFATARTLGGDIDALLSDAWANWTEAKRGKGANPWDNWDDYKTAVTSIVKWHLTRGMMPQYWEIQNEPDQAGWYKAGSTPTTDLILEQFKVAHDAIRSVIPDAKIVGPSLGAFDRNGEGLLDMRRFVEFADREHLRIDVLSWHELGGDCLGSCDAGPRGIAQHVATVRDLLAQHPKLGAPAIHINEFGARETYLEPGMAAGYFAAFTATGVQRAASACWPLTYEGTKYNTCFNTPSMADGLLLPDGTTPAPPWYVWREYAAMTGSALAGSAGRPDMSVVATRATDGTIRVLVGRHAGAGVASAGQPAAVRVVVRIGSPSSGYSMSTRTVVATRGAGEETSTPGQPVGPASSDGLLDLGAYTFANGSCMALELTRA